MRRAAVVSVVVVVVVVAGCGGAPAARPPAPPAGPRACERVADHLVGLMQPVDPETGAPIERDPETADKIARVLIERCRDDRWSDDAQACMRGLASWRDIDACAPKLTDAQRDAFGRAFAAAFGGPERAGASSSP